MQITFQNIHNTESPILVQLEFSLRSVCSSEYLQKSSKLASLWPLLIELENYPHRTLANHVEKF